MTRPKKTDPRHFRKELKRRIFNDNERNCKQFILRLSEQSKKELNEVWKCRDFPDPFDNMKSIPFNSCQQYVEFCIRGLNSCGPQFWYIFKYILNPDFKDKK